MATTRKKKVQGTEVGLRQSSLLVFFSKPLKEKTHQQQLIANNNPQEDSHSSTQDGSFSSYTKDDAGNLRWSQLLSGKATWFSASILPVSSSEDHGMFEELHKSDQRSNELFPSTHKKRHSSSLAFGLASQNEGKKLHTEALEKTLTNSDGDSCLDSSRPADDQNYVAPDNGCLRQHLPSQDGDKGLDTETDHGEAFMECFDPNSNTGDCFHVQPSSDTKKNLDIPKVVVSTPKPAGSLKVKSPSNVDVESLSGELVVKGSTTGSYLLEPGPANNVCTLEEEYMLQPDVKMLPQGAIQESLSADDKCAELLDLESHDDDANHSHGVSRVNANSKVLPEGAIPLYSVRVAAEFSITTSTDANMRFMKLKRGSGRRVSAIEEPMEAPITDYEREREENIQRNQHFLQKLGISSSALSHVKEHSCASVKQKGKVIPKVKAPPSLPVRRSRRLLQESGDAHTMVDQKKEESLTDPEAFCYDDSSVLRYTCEEQFVSSLVPYKCPELSCSKDVGNILGFRPYKRVLEDAYLTRIYTMSACFVSQSHRTLLAAGGHQGHIAIFGTSCCYDMDDSLSMVFDNDLPQELGSLLSWKASSGWISGVKFLSTLTRENATLLLSSSNDGSLVLWDINKQQKNQQSATRMANMPPLKVMEARGIHSNGIFSMHEFLGRVVTASKDSTIGSSRITEQTILTERSICGHHCGAIRGVNFRDASTIADCGADGLICVLDLRMDEPCVLTIDTADATGVNVVEWCPLQEHLLLSASKDPQILLHDIRKAKEPLHKLDGHVHPKVQRCSQIYRPTFVAQGSAIASPGQGSKALSLYSVQTGKAISRGHIGYDATMVMWTTGRDASACTLWVASRKISQLIPMY